MKDRKFSHFFAAFPSKVSYSLSIICGQSWVICTFCLKILFRKGIAHASRHMFIFLHSVAVLIYGGFINPLPAISRAQAWFIKNKSHTIHDREIPLLLSVLSKMNNLLAYYIKKTYICSELYI